MFSISILFKDIHSSDRYINIISLSSGSYGGSTHFSGGYFYHFHKNLVNTFTSNDYIAIKKNYPPSDPYESNGYIPEYSNVSNILSFKEIKYNKHEKPIVVFTDSLYDYYFDYNIDSAHFIKAYTNNPLCKLGKVAYLENIEDNVLRMSKYEYEYTEFENKQRQEREERKIQSKLSQEAFDKSQKEYEQRLIKTYGKSNAQLMMNFKVKIGWNKDMCAESWGMPYHTSQLITQQGVVDIWIYEGFNYLHFTNNKLTGIQNFTW